jgi:hypothetical protein
MMQTNYYSILLLFNNNNIFILKKVLIIGILRYRHFCKYTYEIGFENWKDNMIWLLGISHMIPIILSYEVYAHLYLND